MLLALAVRAGTNVRVQGTLVTGGRSVAYARHLDTVLGLPGTAGNEPPTKGTRMPEPKRRPGDPTPTTGSRELDNYENAGRMEVGYQAIHAVSLPGRWSAWRDRRRIAKAKARAMTEHADRKKNHNT